MAEDETTNVEEYSSLGSENSGEVLEYAGSIGSEWENVSEGGITVCGEDDAVSYDGSEFEML